MPTRGEAEGRGGRGTRYHAWPQPCMTIDKRIPTMPRRSTSGFHRPGGHRLPPSAKRSMRCSASRMMVELHPTKNCFRGGTRELPRVWERRWRAQKNCRVFALPSEQNTRYVRFCSSRLAHREGHDVSTDPELKTHAADTAQPNAA